VRIEPINIPDFIQRELSNKIKSNTVNCHLFDVAQESIFNLIETDSWKRYITSEHFLKLCLQAKAGVLGEVRIAAVENCSYRAETVGCC
jgi:hypothetical protein